MEKKWAYCCCFLVVLVFFGGAGGGFLLGFLELGLFTAKTAAETVIHVANSTIYLTIDLIEVHFDEFKDKLEELKLDFDKPSEWLPDPRAYSLEIVKLSEKDEKKILDIFIDINNTAGIFLPKEEFEAYNETYSSRGQLGELVGTRRKRNTGGYSRICPAYIPEATHLVAFADSNQYGQLVSTNRYFQWVFNEECSGMHCTSGGCNCRKIARREQAYVWLLKQNEPAKMIQKLVKVNSCVAVR